MPVFLRVQGLSQHFETAQGRLLRVLFVWRCALPADSSERIVLHEGRRVNRRLVKIGGIGSVVTALCCFTPVLVWLAAGLGVSAVLGYLDLVLLPLLGVFLLVLLVGLFRGRGNTRPRT